MLKIVLISAVTLIVLFFLVEEISLYLWRNYLSEDEEERKSGIAKKMVIMIQRVKNGKKNPSHE